MQSQNPSQPTIKVNLIPINRYNRPGTLMTPTRVCVHNSGSPGTGAERLREFYGNVAKGYWQDPNVCTSTQYIVGMDGAIIQVVPDNEIAYAAAGHNNGTIHIEVCHADTSGTFTEMALESLIWLIRNSMKRYGIGIADVVRHYDLTGKACPAYYVKNAGEWTALKARIVGKAPVVGDKVLVTAPYAASAYADKATSSAAVGKNRYVTQVIAGAAFPYRLGVKKGDTSAVNTSGFAKAAGLRVI